MDEQIDVPEKKQEWFQPIAKTLLTILIGTLLSIIWFGWVKIDIYDKHLKLVDTNALWSIILLLIGALSWTLVTNRSLKKRLKEKPPHHVVFLPEQKSNEKPFGNIIQPKESLIKRTFRFWR